VPTLAETARFRRDFKKLAPHQRMAFRSAVRKFLADLPSRRFRSGLRVKLVQGTDGIFEMTWADDGRVTFQYGPEVIEGQTQVIWRRVGTHSIPANP